MKRLLLGGALGCAAMYFLDPQLGRRRRAIARDRIARAARAAGEAGRITALDAAQRAQGVLADTKKLLQGEVVSDETLVGRVRAALGRVVSHPHAIGATVDRGHVTLTGPILAEEVRGLLRSVRGVPGVRGVSDGLTVHLESGGVPSLQGGTPRHGARFELLQDSWSPAARLLAGALGAGLMLRSAHERGLRGSLLGVAGGGLLARAVANRDLGGLIGLGGQGIAVQKVIAVNAPVEEVFAFWTDYQNFPRFMSKVREVQPAADGRSHWVVAGPAGVPVHWTAEVTRVISGALIEWRATTDSEIRHRGSVRFDPSSRSGRAYTRVTVRLNYEPPAGAFGHAVAVLFGADPKSEMDADLLRMKTMIETGRPSHDAARPASRES
jgi:uncharacterized membrane protein